MMHSSAIGASPRLRGARATPMTADVSFDALRETFASPNGPVVVCNKSHSGSRLVAALLAEGGVFMGAHRNESEDALDVLALVEPLVTRHYPDYATLWTDGTAAREAARLASACFERHLAGHDRRSSRPW